MVAIRPSDLHRIYIQSLLTRRALREEVALELYKRAIGVCRANDDKFEPTHPPNSKGLGSFLEDISTLLEEVGMTVKRGREETGTGKEWIALVNTDPKDVALHATDYSPLEISYYREIVAAIITSYPGNSLGSIAALTIASNLKTTIAKSQAEVVLSSLTSRGWLAKSKRGRYSLGPRAMLELENYVKGEFEDYYQTCGRCHKFIQSGVVCTYGDCETHMHPYCYAPLLLRPNPSCPQCKNPFDTYPPKDLGEKAVPEREDQWNTLKRKRNRPSGAGSSRANGDNEDEDEEEDADDFEEEEMEGSVGGATSRSTRQNGRPRRSAGTQSSRSQSRIPETQQSDV